MEQQGDVTPQQAGRGRGRGDAPIRGRRRSGSGPQARGSDLTIKMPPASRTEKPTAQLARESDQPGTTQQLPSPLPTPTLAMPASMPGAAPSKLPTIPSDEDSCTSDGSSHSQRGRPPSSGSSSSVSEETRAAGPASPDTKRVVPEASAPPTPMAKSNSQDKVRRLSAAEMQQFVEAPESLPVAVVIEDQDEEKYQDNSDQGGNMAEDEQSATRGLTDGTGRLSASELQSIRRSILEGQNSGGPTNGLSGGGGSMATAKPDVGRPAVSSRTLSTPPTSRRQAATTQPSPRRNSFNPGGGARPLHLRSIPSTPILKPPSLGRRDTLDSAAAAKSSSSSSIPLPPMSLPTHLQLELASQRPSQLYIHRPDNLDVPYESAAVKFERLLNLLLLPAFLERTLTFGALACLDAWLYNFTILPMRFLTAVYILAKWVAHVVSKEVLWITGFVWYGLGRLWIRAISRGEDCVPHVDAAPATAEDTGATGISSVGFGYDSSSSRGPMSPDVTSSGAENGMSNSRSNNRHGRVRSPAPAKRSRHGGGAFRHRRTKSMPSDLTAYNKADLLQGAVIIFSAVAMMRLDASRMYHFIRGESDIKLYVIYNILEVGDKLLSAVGQDIFECLFSSETLSRDLSTGRSKVLVPLGMFFLALAYNVLHSAALYFQVITLNVAVNSYSNALLTLLMSNQFVEVKGTVFKRIERDNLFQLTCADIVERFQLVIMLLIIGMRNVVEVGGLSVPGAGGGDVQARSPLPLHTQSSLPHSFTVLPSWLWSGEVLSPFLIILGSEILVDSIKHAYVTKFNNIRRGFYSRVLDILCKDYYTNAFSTPAMTRRLGLAVIPMSCLFIRASFQTYHMFISTRISPPLPPSTHTSLSEESAVPSSPAILAALDRFDTLIRDALGRSVYPYPSRTSPSWWDWTTDDVIAALTMVVVFFLVFLVLLMVKLLLGMVLLAYSRRRYADMMEAEQRISRGQAEREQYETKGKRVGGRGDIELGDERRRWLNIDEKEGLRKRPKPDKTAAEKEMEGSYEGVARYEMVAKRIW